jgi:hypothetical protein
MISFQFIEKTIESSTHRACGALIRLNDSEPVTPS